MICQSENITLKYIRYTPTVTDSKLEFILAKTLIDDFDNGLVPKFLTTTCELNCGAVKSPRLLVRFIHAFE